MIDLAEYWHYIRAGLRTVRILLTLVPGYPHKARFSLSALLHSFPEKWEQNWTCQ